MDKKFSRTLYYLIREERRHTQKAVIEGTSIPQSTVSAIMNGTRSTEPDRMNAIASFFDMSVDEFLSYAEGKKFKHPKLDIQANTANQQNTNFSIHSKEFQDAVISSIAKARIAQDPKKTFVRVMDFDDLRNANHHKIVDKFQQPKLAEEINSIILEIEKLKKVRLKKIKRILKAELDELKDDMKNNEQEAGRKASGDKEKG